MLLVVFLGGEEMLGRPVSCSQLDNRSRVVGSSDGVCFFLGGRKR